MVDRRSFFTSGAAGLAGILASRRAPAYAQGTRLQLLHRVDFIPQGEAELKRQLTEYGKQMKMEVVLETINENDLQTRITATIQSGSGPDIVQMLHNWPHLYGGALADVSDLADWKERDQGKFYTQSEAAARDGSRWLASKAAIASGASTNSATAAFGALRCEASRRSVGTGASTRAASIRTARVRSLKRGATAATRSAGDTASSPAAAARRRAGSSSRTRAAMTPVPCGP